MYSEKDIEKMLGEIEFYGLSVPAEMEQLSAQALAKICNGWGPDSWSTPLRQALTGLAGAYDILALPHDVRFELKVGSCAAADREFYCNALKIWRKRWKAMRYFNPIAWYEFFKIRGCYRLLQTFSWIAWEK